MIVHCNFTKQMHLMRLNYLVTNPELRFTCVEASFRSINIWISIYLQFSLLPNHVTIFQGLLNFLSLHYFSVFAFPVLMKLNSITNTKLLHLKSYYALVNLCEITNKKKVECTLGIRMRKIWVNTINCKKENYMHYKLYG